MSSRITCLVLFILPFILAPQSTLAKQKRARTHRTPVTHPVVLWARTLSQSTVAEERKVAAFKLSHYTQPIYQQDVIDTLLLCTRDKNVQIKVLCAKALGRATSHSRSDQIRKTLLEVYKEDAELRNTLVRTFIARKDNTTFVKEALLTTCKTSNNSEELLTLMQYLENFAERADMDYVIEVYRRVGDEKVKRACVKVLVERGQGQAQVVNILAECAESKETPLALICLSGLQTQAQREPKTWTVLEKTIESTDPDVLLATLDVLQALPVQHNQKITERVVEIIHQTEDSELLEKAVLALGVCGDGSESLVKTLLETLEKKPLEEGVKITAALVLGKQAVNFPEAPKASLEKCAKESKTQSLRTACTLGLKELNSQKPVPKPTPYLGP